MFRNLLRTAFSRRDLFRSSALAATAGLAPSAAPAAPAHLEIGPKIYDSIGVRPVINCRGTLTIIGGSQSLPEVKKAMDEASRHYVHIDELMDAVGHRLAELTGAEWGIVTSGCAAALAHVTAACVAGANPERIQRLPDTSGLKNEVIAPKYSRNVYDHAIRMVGVKIIDVPAKEQFGAAFTDRTAMVMVLAGPEDRGEFGLPFISAIAKERGVPVLVDAAAEDLTIPNVHLQRGADIVCYSGGKVLRGPQCAGFALGRKDILQAAWINSAPHHTFGRPMKIGREEIMGMLAAVEAWKQRDMKAEYAQKRGYLEYIASRVKTVAGVNPEIRDSSNLSNHAPRLTVRWDPAKLGLTGTDVAMLLYEGTPRIDVGPSNRNLEFPPDSIGIGSHMMMPGDEKIVAERLTALLAKPPKRPQAPPSQDAAGNVNGRWDVRIEFVHGAVQHVLLLEQNGNKLVGTHFGERLEGEVEGVLSGSNLRLKSNHRFEGTVLNYRFDGELNANQIAGTVNLGEYGTARWTATKHQYAEPKPVQRPVKPA
jgi:L-seryl-tRNA(Ser) seleniumtransferase